jgi:hypothetical protein
MNQIKSSAELSLDVAGDIADARRAAHAAQDDLRTLKDIELGWIGGGDGEPVWPY